MNKIKLALAMSALMVSSTVLADLNTGLMAYYSFDDCSANDSSGNNNNGAIKGNLSCINSIANKALQFNGASYISIPDSLSLHPTTQLTMSFWIKVDDYTNSWSGIINKGAIFYSDCSATREYTVWLNNTGYLAQGVAGDSGCQKVLSSKKVITKGKWLHYLSVIDRVKHTSLIYINGVLNAKASDDYKTFIQNSYDLRIGFSEESHSLFSPFKGILDEIRLYNRVLATDEITTLYNQGVSINGSINSIDSHTVTCKNETTGQIVDIPATQTPNYDCEAKGLKAGVGDDISILIKGKNQ